MQQLLQVSSSLIWKLLSLISHEPDKLASVVLSSSKFKSLLPHEQHILDHPSFAQLAQSIKTTNAEQRQALVSIVAPFFSRAELNSHGFDLSERAFAGGRQHWKKFGSGIVQEPGERHVHRVTDAQIEGTVASLISHSKNRAFSTVEVSGPKGTITLPRLTSSYATLTRAAEQAVIDCKDLPDGPLSPSSAFRVASSIGLRPEVSLAGLDTISSQLGHQNFGALRVMIKDSFEAFTVAPPAIGVQFTEPSLLELLEICEDFFCNEFYDCAATSHPDPMRCMSYALGIACGDAKHYEPSADGIGRLCRTLPTLEAGLHDVLEQLHAVRHRLIGDMKTTVDEIALELPNRINMLRGFASHIARGWWQAQWERLRFATLPSSVAILVVDFKNKVLPCAVRETMASYFGKEGLSLLGGMFVHSGDASTGRLREFDDLCTDDKDQDSYMALVLTAALALRFKLRHPTMQLLLVQGDCGPTFDSSMYVAGIYQLNKFVLGPQGIMIKEFNLTEPGFGKSALDAHFSVIGTQIAKSVASRHGDITNAASVVHALRFEGGINNSTADVVTINRESKPSCKTIKDISKYNHFEYQQDSMAMRPAHGHPKQVWMNDSELMGLWHGPIPTPNAESLQPTISSSSSSSSAASTTAVAAEAESELQPAAVQPIARQGRRRRHDPLAESSRARKSTGRSSKKQKTPGLMKDTGRATK